tara:strand:+ start:16171 stop:16401 length:231 start_codon:yes stop_codon:yes gene_type:complete
MSAITEKQVLQWKEELKTHKERLTQAQAVVEQESKVISMIEGGIQFGENLLKSEQVDQPSGTVELGQQSEKAPAKK